MDRLKPIGGFFELEVPSRGLGYHPDALALSNGRACMQWILENEKPRKVYVPFYTCYALYQPMQEKGIELEFYKINESLNPVDLPEPKIGELLVFINYFGLKNKQAEKLVQKFARRVVIDDTHRFFFRGYHHAYSFTSARKYFGVPDGAYLYGVVNSEKNIPRNTHVSIVHNIKRLMSQQEEAFQAYTDYEASLGFDLQRISLLSERLLSGLDYSAIANIRKDNFNFLHQHLQQYNKLFIDISELDVPFCYPFLPGNEIDKVLFYQHKLYIPSYWPDMLERNITGFELEKNITRRLLPLPVDHRYTQQDMQRIVNVIIENM